MTIEESEITDLEEAKRIIAQLQKTLTEYEEEEVGFTADGEFTVFLSDHHSEILRKLYEAQALDITLPNPAYWYTNPEFDEAFTDFLEGALDFAWDTYRMDKKARKR